MYNTIYGKFGGINLRVISGTARGKKLLSPKGYDTRPTTDRIKESLFNILAYEIADTYFLDLFSGTGAIGIEALSRGAAKAVFVDKSFESINIIEKNLKNSKLYENAVIMKMDFINAISKLKKEGMLFDIIFLDPPYGTDLAEKAISEIFHSKLLKETGFIIVEQSEDDDISFIDKINILKIKEYTRTKMVFFNFDVNGFVN